MKKNRKKNKKNNNYLDLNDNQNEIDCDLVIDLHGCNVEDATSKIILAIEEARDKEYVNIEIITGHGSGALKMTCENILNEQNLMYEIAHNGGSYIVYILPIF